MVAIYIKKAAELPHWHGHQMNCVKIDGRFPQHSRAHIAAKYFLSFQDSCRTSLFSHPHDGHLDRLPSRLPTRIGSDFHLKM